jgi:uncharacterized membrane protein YdbT with pleckstrin-like domain
MKDYKSLGDRPESAVAGKTSASGSAHYSARPAWTDQWWRVTMLVMLPAALVLALVWGDLRFSPENLRAVYVVVAGVFVYLLVGLIYHRLSWRYLIDGEIIESREGVIARKVRSIRVRDLRNINVNQTLMQRILNVGDVEFSSAGGSGIEVTFRGVSDPLQVKALAHRLQG